MPSLSFEGLPGVGKTTLARLVEAATNSMCVTDLPLESGWEYHHIINVAATTDEQFRYQMELGDYYIRLAQARTINKQLALLDGSNYGVLSRYRGLGSKLAWQTGPESREPDISYLLVTALDSPRLEQDTTKLTPDQAARAEEIFVRRSAILAIYRSFNLTELDATKQPEELLEIVLQGIGRYRV